MAAEPSRVRDGGRAQHRAAPVKARPETLDEVIHQRTRLAILSALTAHDRLAFNDLKALLDVTDGNLSVHARKLEDAGYVRCRKSFRGRTPLTEYSLTAAGRRALEGYLDHMEAIIVAAREAPASG
jgi:DNA-binding HxlR family transcriptional regulator